MIVIFFLNIKYQESIMMTVNCSYRREYRKMKDLKINVFTLYLYWLSDDEKNSFPILMNSIYNYINNCYHFKDSISWPAQLPLYLLLVVAWCCKVWTKLRIIKKVIYLNSRGFLLFLAFLKEYNSIIHDFCETLSESSEKE